MNGKALGLIEVYGYLGAVEALDVALKAANVSLVEVTKVKGGLVTVIICGDVGAVKAAIDASSMAAQKLTKVISCHVIPRPATEILKIIGKTNSVATEQPKITSNINEDDGIDNDEKVISNEVFKTDTEIEDLKPESSPEKFEKNTVSDFNGITINDIDKMPVHELRRFARYLGLDTIPKAEIKFAKRDELLEKIMEFMTRGDN